MLQIEYGDSARPLGLTGRMFTALTLFLLCFCAAAGGHYGNGGQVKISRTSAPNYAEGALGIVHNSADDVQRIFCSVTRTWSFGAATHSTMLFCLAKDATGAIATCASTKDEIADGLAGLSDDSLLRFEFDGSGTCTNIVLYESSGLDRKQ